MKGITYVVGGVGILVCMGIGGYFWLNAAKQPELPPPIPPVAFIPTQLALIGTVSDVNFEAVAADGPSVITFSAAGTEAVYVVAVPSMGLASCAASSTIADPFQLAPGDMIDVRGLLNEAGQIVPCTDSTHYLRVSRTEEKTEFGIAFTYKKGPQGYVLEEQTLEAVDEKLTLLYSAVFTNTDAYAAFVNSVDAQESPEHFSVRVYENVGELRAAEWVTVYEDEAGMDRIVGEITELDVLGEPAVRYVTDGLYPSDTYVVTHGAMVYIIAGMFNDPASLIATDFSAFMLSLKLLEVPVQVSE